MAINYWNDNRFTSILKMEKNVFKKKDRLLAETVGPVQIRLGVGMVRVRGRNKVLVRLCSY